MRRSVRMKHVQHMERSNTLGLDKKRRQRHQIFDTVSILLDTVSTTKNSAIDLVNA